MKVIDIMQKIANKERFKFRICDVNYYVDNANYICEEDGKLVEWRIDDEWLNTEAEIIEEDKKIEKMGNSYMKQIGENEYISEPFSTNERKIIDKINEIIDYINRED